MTTKTAKAGSHAVNVVTVNVKPGAHIARLTDPEAAAHVAELTARAAKDSAFALDWLIQHKLATPTGKLPKRFGG